MKPGIYYGMSFEEYRRIDAINASAIKEGLTSMKHMRAYLSGDGKKDTPDMAFGRAAHCAILEPERFASEYLTSTQCQAKKKDGNQCGNSGRYRSPEGKWYCGTTGHAPSGSDEPGQYLTQTDYASITNLIAELGEIDLLKYLRNDSRQEVVVVAEFHGFKIKCRLDALSGDRLVIPDFKKVQRGKSDIESFRKTATSFRYHIQAFLYSHAIAQHTGAMPRFLFIFGEDSTPNCVNATWADEDDIRIGRKDCIRVLDDWRRCESEGKYNGTFLGTIQHGCLTGWYKDQADEVIFDDE